MTRYVRLTALVCRLPTSHRYVFPPIRLVHGPRPAARVRVEWSRISDVTVLEPWGIEVRGEVTGVFLFVLMLFFT